nr:insecticidal protein IPD102Ab [Pseudomonas donghuensis]
MAISIAINAGQSSSASTVIATGTVQNVITDTERTLFNIQDGSLKAAVSAYFGRSPNDAYVCSPTPWGDLYQTYNWPQVQATLSVVSARIVSETSNPIALNTNTFTNHSSVPAEFNCGVTQEVTVTAESNWSSSSEVGISQTISYGISFLGAGAQGETALSFTQTWEQGGSQSESVTLGSSAGVALTLQPGQTVEAILSASKGVLTVEVEYQITLAGVTAVNYNPTYQGHHFWTLDINNVMSAGKLSNVITSKETIVIDYFTNTTITVQDPESQDVIRTLVTSVRPGISS